MNKSASMGESVSDIIFKVANEENFRPETLAALKDERDSAMIKIASYQTAAQEPYPSPFLNLSDTHIPKTTSEIFRWCKYFYTFDPLIAGAVNALAAFPITEVYIEDKENSEDNEESDTLKTYKRVFFEALHIYNLLVGIGIDYFLYGNAFVFGELWNNPNTSEIEWRNMIRLDPDRIIIDYNPVTQEKIYKWRVPNRVVNVIKNKKPIEEYNKIPEVMRQAVVNNKAIVLNPKNIYHFSRPTDSLGDNNIWGTPVIANVIKLLMYRNVLRQAQEAIAREHIVPMRVYYIQKTDTYSPEANWNNVASSFAAELMKTVRDPNHKVVSPVPVGVMNVGGEGRQLLVTPEIEQVQSEILAGMNVPREFIFGGVSYSGSAISLKILENQFITYRLSVKDFMQNFVIRNMARARGEWMNGKDDANMVQVKMIDLKMQDDVQQKNLIIELNRTGKVPDNYLWKTFGMDPDRIKAMLKKEALDKVDEDAEIQMKQLEVQMKIRQKQMEQEAKLAEFQQKLAMKHGLTPDPSQMSQQSQNSMPEAQMGMDATGTEQQPSGGVQQAQEASSVQQSGPSPQDQADARAVSSAVRNLLPMKPEDRKIVISHLPQSMQQAIVAELAKLEKNDDTKTDMRPMPEKLPPRRNSLKS